MDTSHFELIVARHSLAPHELLYNSNALAGECGEVANVVKKIQMAQMKPEWVTANEGGLPTLNDFAGRLDDELSDVLFYLTRMALDNGATLEQLMALQLRKLVSQSEKYQRTFLK